LTGGACFAKCRQGRRLFGVDGHAVWSATVLCGRKGSKIICLWTHCVPLEN
jgi:hypothetical protein